MIGPVMTTLLMAALAALAGVARWVTFRRAVRSGRFDDPVGAIFAVWLDRGDPAAASDVASHPLISKELSYDHHHAAARFRFER